jgi:glycine cleavage system aminomethyltransferase T/glycine/D-amino acid oxidase-like deaminating enzyme
LSPLPELPDSARCVVIGGGVGGASIAYHLARLGWRDVVLVEQHELTEGTTWHSAGFVGQLRSTISQTRMIMYSSELYAELEEVSGRDPGWRGVGGIRVACTPERVEELHRQAMAATTYGLDLELMSPAETQERMPLLAVDDVLEAAWLPGDGYLDPELLALALAEGARRGGVALHPRTRVTGLDVRSGRVVAVRTDRGTIAAEHVVIAAGAASGVVARMAGVAVPIVPMRHQYVVTEPLDPPVGEVPTVRDPDHIVYFRPEAGGLLVGGYARDPVTWDVADPLAAPRTLFERDDERFAEPWAGAERRVPAVRRAQIAKVVNGPEAFTPDGEFVLGETEVGGLWIAAGFCVHGLAGAGGVGKVMAEWLVDGLPEYDVAGMDVLRFGAHHRSRRYARVRALDAYSRYYDVVYPHEERDAGRPLRVSAAYARLRELDASFGEKSGWERANWLEANAAVGDEALRPRGWAGKHWSPAIAAECLATRDAAALYDQSSFAKLEVRGRGAATALGRLCANDVDRAVGTAVYTQLLNPRGGIEADLTVTRRAEDRFQIVTGTAFGVHDLAWIRRHLPDDGSVQADDVTGARSCFCLWGPAARDILQPLCDDDLSHEAFPFLRAHEITVGAVPVFAQRITFVGELGWELYCPTEYGRALWDLVWAAGRGHGLRAGGYRAIDSLRLEKGYRVWGTDITPETTPDEAGLGFAVRIDKAGGFIGRQALLAAREAGGPEQRLRCLVLDDPSAVCLGNEPVRVDGTPRGRVTSGGYGHRVDESIAYAYLPAEVDVGARVEVGVFGAWVGAEVAVEPRYDPSGERIKGGAAAVA